MGGWQVEASLFAHGRGLLYDGGMLKGILIPLVALGVVFAFGAMAESPTVTGPIMATAPVGDSSHQYPFFAALEDLKGRGYVEQEFFVSGTAARYNTPDGATGSVRLSTPITNTKLASWCGGRPAPRSSTAR